MHLHILNYNNLFAEKNYDDSTLVTLIVQSGGAVSVELDLQFNMDGKTT